MDCPACGFSFGSDQKECPRCGLILSRYKKRPADSHKEVVPICSSDDVNDSESLISAIFFHVKPGSDSVDFSLRTAFAVCMMVWGVVLAFAARSGEGGGFGFWHLVNLPFHEAGHIFTRPFGHLIMSLGGTLGQLAMPLVCMAVFLLKKRDPFAAGFCLWWLGVNFLDIAPYIGDARSLTLPLLGGNVGSSSPYGFHDWEYILTETGLLSYDTFFSRLAIIIGALMIVASGVWWASLLKKYHGSMEG